MLTFFGCVEGVEEIEDFVVFEVLAVCEELDVFFDGVITFSFGFSFSRVVLAFPCPQSR